MTVRTPGVFDAPVEIVKAIMDTAARDKKSTAATLMHVCRTTRQWATPILYESVELDNRSSVQFERMLGMPSSPRLASSVKTLRARCLPSVDLLSCHCSEVEAISLYNYDVPKLHRLVLPSLAHVTVAGSLRYSHFTTSMYGLAKVTHLRFANDVPRLSEDFIQAVPKLTHFSCCYLPGKKSRHEAEGLERCLRIVLEAPALRMAVICARTPHASADALACALGSCASDPRVVIAPPVEARDATENLSPTYDRLWKLGERKVMQAELR
ncbi:hypothetical protein BU17DRAFT_66626 [Hysterangium stoloniferum]|nr:hypothetical protein BU17DRAFT_66626 [Hysterangium stoloniferum]